MSSSGGARPSRPTASPAFTGCSPNAPTARSLGPDVDIEIDAYDECNTVIDVKRIIAQIRAAGGGFVGLVGVQSNQFPRALDLARQFRAAGIPVVDRRLPCQRAASRCCPSCRADLQEALDLGITLFAGEGEGRMADAAARHRRGPAEADLQLPRRHAGHGGGDAADPAARGRRRASPGNYTSFDAGRGCPFQCSFCTIINVQGRKSRYRTPDDVEAIVRANAAQGITRFFITDDNFARNKNWEPILDRLIELREKEGFKIRLLLQVDTLCHRIPRLHREGGARGLQRGVHRAGEHQSRNP